MRLVALLLVLAFGACAAETGPPGQVSPSNVNPVTGQRGGSGR